MLFNGVPVSGNKIADCFADFFDEKVKNLVKNVGVDKLVENGTQKLVSDEVGFMTRDRVYECLKQLKSKNCEGYDRIPQKILLDGLDALLTPFSKLFAMILYSFAFLHT